MCGQKEAILFISDAFKVTISCILILAQDVQTHFGRKWTDVNLWNYLWMTFFLVFPTWRSACGRKTKMWFFKCSQGNKFTAFEPCIRWPQFSQKWTEENWSNYAWMTIYLTCFTIWFWKENMSNFGCSRRIQMGDLLHSNPANNEHMSARNGRR